MPQINMNLLDDASIKAIINQTYELLEETGVSINNAEVRGILSAAGCPSNGNVFTIPRALIEKARETAPSYIEIFDRNGKPAMKLGGMNAYFGPGPTCPSFFDARTGERRPAIKQDAADTAKVCDSLPNIDFVMSLCSIGGVAPELADVHEIDAMVRSTSKPLVGWGFSKAGVQYILDICGAVAGSAEKLAEKPFLIIYIEPITPFIHPDDVLDELLLLVRNRIPVVYCPGMILGATTPVTMAGALTVGLADALVGLLISQLVREGAPFISGAPAGPMDMRTMNHAYGAPEAELMNVASCQLMHALGIPVFAAAGASDSKVTDAQAAAEAMLQIIGAIGFGGNLTHDIGFMDCGLTGSITSLVMCDELIGMARRFMRGIDVDDDHLAKETIQEVGIGGNYIAEEHTSEFFREELWMPKLLERRSYEPWAADGKKDLAARCFAKAKDILAAPPRSPLPEETLNKLDAILKKAEAGE